MSVTLTVDRRPLTVDSPLTDVDFDWTHMLVTQEPLDPPVRTDDVADIMLTSAGPHLSARNRDADVMLMSACHVGQSQRDTCHPRINSAFSIFRNELNLGNSYDLRKIQNQDQNSSKIELYAMNP